MTDLTPPNSPGAVAATLAATAASIPATPAATIPPATTSIYGAAPYVSPAPTSVSVFLADLAKAKTELSFVEANWGKLSIIVVAAAIVGALVARLI